MQLMQGRQACLLTLLMWQLAVLLAPPVTGQGDPPASPAPSAPPPPLQPDSAVAVCQGAYRNLTDASRNFFAPANYDDFNCDKLATGEWTTQDYTGAAWYRFTDAVGYQMLDYNPDTIKRCGTQAPGWLNGAHPLPQEGIVNRTVCFAWLGDGCWQQVAIQVVSCTEFYLYYLPDVPTCHARYCGLGPAPSPPPPRVFSGMVVEEYVSGRIHSLLAFSNETDVTFSQASAMCASLGLGWGLAAPVSQDMLRFIVSKARQHTRYFSAAGPNSTAGAINSLWLGWSYNTQDAAWKSLTSPEMKLDGGEFAMPGSRNSFGWCNSAPDVVYTNKQCTVLWNSGIYECRDPTNNVYGELNDVSCEAAASADRGFVCEQPQQYQYTPSDKSYSSTLRFIKSSIPVTWAGAQAACAAQGMNLVAPDTADFVKFIVRTAQKALGFSTRVPTTFEAAFSDSMWTGWNDVETEDDFVTPAGMHLNDTGERRREDRSSWMWCQNEPNNYQDDEHCVMIWQSVEDFSEIISCMWPDGTAVGKMADVSCNNFMVNYVCEERVLYPSPPPPSPPLPPSPTDLMSPPPPQSRSVVTGATTSSRKLEHWHIGLVSLAAFISAAAIIAVVLLLLLRQWKRNADVYKGKQPPEADSMSSAIISTMRSRSASDPGPVALSATAYKGDEVTHAALMSTAGTSSMEDARDCDHLGIYIKDGGTGSSSRGTTTVVSSTPGSNAALAAVDPSSNFNQAATGHGIESAGGSLTSSEPIITSALVSSVSRNSQQLTDPIANNAASSVVITHDGPASGNQSTPPATISGKLASEDSRCSGKPSGVSAPSSKDTSLVDVPEPMQQVQMLVSELSGAGSEHLTVLEPIGQGGFGTVYKGIWRNLDVAVKTVLFQDANNADLSSASTLMQPEGSEVSENDEGTTVRGRQKRQQAIVEAAVGSSITHPNVVATYHYDVVSMSKSEDTVGQRGLTVSMPYAQQADWKLYLVQEYCDGGTLSSAFDRRLLHPSGVPELAAILNILVDVSEGMRYIHSKNIIHGDLNPCNILLKHDPNRLPFCFVSKVSDFGLSAPMAPGKSHLSNMRSGTPFYTAPEVVINGVLTKAADVFSFGVVMWELYTGMLPFRQDADGSYTPSPQFPMFPAHAPVAYATLALQCLHKEPKARPTFDVIVTRLLELEVRLLQSLKQALLAAQGGAGLV